MAEQGLATAVKAIQARKSKRKQATKAPRIPVQEPTPERMAMGETRRAGMATEFKPVIDTLRDKHKITPEQHTNLSYYRQQALLAEKSPTRDSCDFSVRGGSGNGPSMAILSAMSETYRLEAKMGPNRRFARFCVVDDHSLRQWCLERFGGTQSGGRIRPVNEKANMARALVELRLIADQMEVG